jgi:hypothetical protein
MRARADFSALFSTHSMDLIVSTDRGLYCAEGDFHIDPWRPVPRASIEGARREGKAISVAKRETLHDHEV